MLLNPTSPWADDNTASSERRSTGVALFGVFWSWVGFEMAPNYAEESRDPRRIMAIATYASVIGLGASRRSSPVCSWNGWGMENVAAGVNGQFEGGYGSAFYPLYRSVLRRAARRGPSSC